MKKSLILLGMLSIGYAYAQQGNVGINTTNPQATLDIKPNAENTKAEAKTNQGIIAPRLSKVRVANIETPIEGTLVYVTDENPSPISAYTGTDTKVSKITEKGYYYYNGTEWVKSGNNTEWVYDDTTKRINLKRSGQATGFTNKVYYKTNGNFINTDADTFYQWWRDTSLTNIADVDYNILYRLSQNITPYYSNISDNYNKPLSRNHLEINEHTPLDKPLNTTTTSSVLNISPDNVTPIYWASSTNGTTVKQDNANTNYIMGSSGYTILLDGTVSGYATAGRFETLVNTPNKQEGSAMGVATYVSTGEKTTSSIKDIIGVNAYIQFDNTTAGNTVDGKATLYGGSFNFKNKQPKIPTLAGFYYDGVSAAVGGLDRVGTHYGIYLGNVDRAQSNYAIYSNAGKVRFGDNVGVGIDNPSEKLEVNGAIKVANTASTCTANNRGTIKFVNDNFYGCKSTGWVLLNN